MIRVCACVYIWLYWKCSRVHRTLVKHNVWGPWQISTGLVQSSDTRGTLSIMQGGREQDCLRGAHARSPVLFAQAMVSGCTLKYGHHPLFTCGSHTPTGPPVDWRSHVSLPSLQEGANCSLVSNVLLEVLRGSAKMQYVAAFGTPTLDGSLDWVPLETVPVSGVRIGTFFEKYVKSKLCFSFPVSV